METDEFISAVRRFRHEYVGIAVRYLHDTSQAEDAVQDALIRLWAARERIEPPEKFRQYGATATRNVCLDILKAAHGTRVVSIDNAHGDSLSQRPASAMEDEENEAWMQRCIRELPMKYRELLQMRNVEGISYKAMAAMLECPESSVRGMVARARAMLVAKLKERRIL